MLTKTKVQYFNDFSVLNLRCYLVPRYGHMHSSRPEQVPKWTWNRCERCSSITISVAYPRVFCRWRIFLTRYYDLVIFNDHAGMSCTTVQLLVRHDKSWPVQVLTADDSGSDDARPTHQSIWLKDSKRHNHARASTWLDAASVSLIRVTSMSEILIRQQLIFIVLLAGCGAPSTESETAPMLAMDPMSSDAAGALGQVNVLGGEVESNSTPVSVPASNETDVAGASAASIGGRVQSSMDAGQSTEAQQGPQSPLFCESRTVITAASNFFSDVSDQSGIRAHNYDLESACTDTD